MQHTNRWAEVAILALFWATCGYSQSTSTGTPGAASQNTNPSNTTPPVSPTVPTAAPTGQTLTPDQVVRTEITVTEGFKVETPSSLTVVDKLAVAAQPGVNLDDRLRSVPGFSLFRRSSSLVANPTTQGVSLRGLGSSGASRSLVLWDGVPLNDPFGGWVYWTRVSPDELERVEVVRGGSTSLFGDRAMAGTMSLFSRNPEGLRLLGSYEGGSQNTHQLTGGAGFTHRWLGLSANLRAFQTDGFYIIPERFRGTVDAKAGVDFVAGNLRVDLLGARQRASLKLDTLAEQRRNGTLLVGNSSSIGTLSGLYTREIGLHSLSLLGWRTQEEYRAAFSTIAANRLTERLTTRQTVPATANGGAAYYRHNTGRGSLLGGADITRVEGYSLESLLPTGFRGAGGWQWQQGGFLQADHRFGSLQLFGGMRLHRTSVTATNPLAAFFAPRTAALTNANGFFSPSGGVAYGRGPWRLRGSAYRSFRAPTLNELFREFRAGNAVTRANSALRPEFSKGLEAGLEYRGERRQFSLGLYRNSLTNLITNVTLSTSPTLIERQRQNASAALTRGVEASASAMLGPVRAEGSYLFASSRLNTTQRTRIAQVPRHQGNAQLIWASSNGKTLLSGGLRMFDYQFDDDLNLFRLPGYASLQVAARRELAYGLSAQLSVENALNREFYVAFSPVPSNGAPRLWRAGLRWDGQLRKGPVR